MYPIEQGLETPPYRDKAGRPQSEEVATARRLKVGDSFLIPNGNISRVSSIMCNARKRKAIIGRYVCRTVTGGVRVWRAE